ncbi:MAG: TIGR03619 family F420-dependent LLM class oxidoreductase [bacterium]
MKFTMALALTPPEQYLPLARTADECGIDSIALPDSVFYPEKVSADYLYTADGSRFWDAETPWLEPWVAIPAMAAVTTRIRFYTHVLKLAIRNPLLVAKTVGSAAVLSGNRVGLGVGLGWIPEEFAWCGTDYASRGPRANEAIEIIRLLLAGGMVEYHGKHYDFDRLQMSPAPTAPVPIYVGGHSKPALKRAARLGDGWCAAMATEEEIRGYIRELAALRKELGREHEPYEIQVACTDVFDLDGMKRLAEAGVTDFITAPWMFAGVAPDEPVTAKQDGIRRFADEYLAAFR